MKSALDLIVYINELCIENNIDPSQLFWYGYEGEDTGIGFVIKKESSKEKYLDFLSDKSVSKLDA